MGISNKITLKTGINKVTKGLYPGEAAIDCFAGGGGFSTGMEMAGLKPAVAINHDLSAIEMHKQNHPNTIHYCEDIWGVNPTDVLNELKRIGYKSIGYLHASPDCTHFSVAKGGKPVEKKIRGLSWVVINWALKTNMRTFSLENVKEIESWGPLVEDANGKMKPDPERYGETFKGFIKILSTGLKPSHPAFKEMYHALKLEFNYDIKEKLRLVKGLGYDIKYRVFNACDFGAGTTRPRLFMIARNDGLPLEFPAITHGESEGLKPLVPAANFINWNLPSKSIFNRKKPLADATLKRVFKGLEREVLENDDPFIVDSEMTVPFITECANASNQRNIKVTRPLPTITAYPKGGSFALVDAKLKKIDDDLTASYLIKFRNGGISQSLKEPLHTITSGGNHYGLITAYLISYYGNGKSHSLKKPLNTITTKDRYAVVIVKGNKYIIEDIRLRMLDPEELYGCQGFPSDYKFKYNPDGSKRTKSDQVKKCGNSVSPIAGAAIASALVTKFDDAIALPLAS